MSPLAGAPIIKDRSRALLITFLIPIYLFHFTYLVKGHLVEVKYCEDTRPGHQLLIPLVEASKKNTRFFVSA